MTAGHRFVGRSHLVRHSYHSEVVRRIEVDERKASDEQDDEPTTYCEVKLLEYVKNHSKKMLSNKSSTYFSEDTSCVHQKLIIY